jgi:hypothetical protein
MPATKLSLPSLPPLSSSFFCIIRTCSDITADQITFIQLYLHFLFPDVCTALYCIVLFSGSLLCSVLSTIFCISQIYNVRYSKLFSSSFIAHIIAHCPAADLRNLNTFTPIMKDVCLPAFFLDYDILPWLDRNMPRQNKIILFQNSLSACNISLCC